MSVKVPPGLIDMLQKFTIAVLHQKPDNFVKFASHYFVNLYKQQKDGKTKKSKQSGQKVQKAERISLPDSAPLDGDDRPETPKKEEQIKSDTSEKHDPAAVTEEGKVVHGKTDEQRARIIAFNKNNHLFRSLNEAQMAEVIDAMFEKKFSEGEHVIKEGEEEDNYYIINSGTYDIFIGGKKYGVYKDKGSFADLALTYKQPTAVTIVATSDGSAWAMDKDVFQQIILRNTYKRRKTYAQLIEKVPNLTNDSDEEDDDDDGEMAGLQKLLRGILKYRYMSKHNIMKQFKEVKHTPQTSAVMFSCIDSRLVMSRLVHQDVGDMFGVKNAGNLVPNNDSLSFETVTTEPGALELGCIIGNIRHVVVCGHSDCKAMHALIDMRDSIQNREGSPLQLWLKRHGARTVAKYNELLKAGGVGPITFQGESPDKTFEAFIDSENRLAPVDKLSQVNTLQQMQNIASYPFLHEKLEKGDVRLHAFWFDINTGDFYMFSREKKRFIEISEETYKDLVAECEARQPKADGKARQSKADVETTRLNADGEARQPE